MSIRLLTTRLFKNGRWLVQSYFKRDIHLNLWNHEKPRAAIKIHSTVRAELKANEFRSNSFLRFGNQARRLFIDNVLSRVTSPYSVDLRQQATKKLLYGDSTPFFALVGVSLASGDGILTKDDELEAVCWEIRHAMAKFQSKASEKDIENRLDEDLGLDLLNIGPPIAKGCSAVVYAAAVKDDATATGVKLDTTIGTEEVENIGARIQQFGGSVDNLSVRPPLSNISLLPVERYLSVENLLDVAPDNNQNSASKDKKKREVRFKTPPATADIGARVKLGKRSRLLSAPVDLLQSELGQTMHQFTEGEELKEVTNVEYPLALKMMFNYDIQSNAAAILKAMYKETVPAIRRTADTTSWEQSFLENTNLLPPHPNVVEMYGVFCDQVPNLSMSSMLYPMALPQRLNPQGYGRNMSLFLLMKRYNCSLNEYLENNEITMRTRILLFTQLLEAVAHLNRHGVAHRDLKSDNILIELHPNMPPTLVVSDFGCCIADKTHGLQIPYGSDEMDKGGNAALMAPEIITKTPGAFSLLNYTKADLWACGTIAYEIFGDSNPFYANAKLSLKNSNYKEEMLPPMGENVPPLVQRLVQNILQRNPTQRLSPDVAANVMQLFLWSPSSWLRTRSDFVAPSSNEILQWLLSLSTKILCEGSLQACSETMGRRTYTEYLLIASFLARAQLKRVKQAIDWIHATS